MNLLSFFKRGNSAPVARERLQLLLAHERAGGSNSDLIGKLREDILEAIAKHVTIDRDRVQVRMDRGGSISTLEVDVEIRAPADAALKAA